MIPSMPTPAFKLVHGNVCFVKAIGFLLTIYFNPKQHHLTTNSVHIVTPGVQWLKVTPYIWHMFATETMAIYNRKCENSDTN